jgi:hypothetical protein
MERLAYQALLSNPDNLNRVRAARNQILRLGGDLRIDPPNALGLVLVTLWLPHEIVPESLLPDVPFYPA